MAEDLYEGFAERYDLFWTGDPDPGEVAFFRRLVEADRVRRVLDCACGTGRDLRLFHSFGCEVVGSDISESMLAQAARNLAAWELEVPLRRADYRELPQHFERPFDAVVCLNSSILHMPDEGEALRALASMRAVLRDGGLLVLTQGTTDRQWREKPRFLLAADTEAVSRLFAIDYRGEGARYHILDVFHGEKGGELKVWSVDYPRMYLRDDQERLLKEARFGQVTFYGSYRGEPYDPETSGRLIAVARRG